MRTSWKRMLMALVLLAACSRGGLDPTVDLAPTSDLATSPRLDLAADLLTGDLTAPPPAPPRFASPVGFTVGNGYGSITTADLNRDGVSDILLGNESLRGFSVFLGKGDGTLGSSIDTRGPAGSAAITFVLAADA